MKNSVVCAPAPYQAGAILLAGLSAVVLGLSRPSAAAEESGVVIIHRQGTATRATDANRRALLTQCETVLRGVDDRFRLVADERLLADLRKKEWCVEVRYPAGKELSIPILGQTRQVSWLLVPLSGRFGADEARAVIFTNTTTGAYVSSKGTKALRQTLGGQK